MEIGVRRVPLAQVDHVGLVADHVSERQLMVLEIRRETGCHSGEILGVQCVDEAQHDGTCFLVCLVVAHERITGILSG